MPLNVVVDYTMHQGALGATSYSSGLRQHFSKMSVHVCTAKMPFVFLIDRTHTTSVVKIT
jgi:hypothetical protein